MSTKLGPARTRLAKMGVRPITLGRVLESTRLGEEESLAEFAKKLGISRTNLSDIEKGRRFVSIEKAAEFARVLGYSEQQYVRLCIQDQIKRAGLKMEVSIKAS